MTDSTFVYKVLTSEEAAGLMTTGAFAGSPDDIRDGFIHLSTAAQLQGTLNRHFAAKSRLILGFLPSDRLGPALRMEPSRGGALFPHLYRPLALADIAAFAPIPDEREDWRPPVVRSES